MKNAVSPKTLFPDVPGEVFAGVENGGIAERAAEMYRPKTYLERFKPHYGFANVAGYVFQAFAVACAFTFAQRLFANLLPDAGRVSVVASCLIAGGVLVALEVAKRLFFGDFIKSAVTGSGVRALPLLGNVALIAVAVYTATEGAKDWMRSQADRSGEIKTAHLAVRDSIEKTYSAQLAVERKALADFKKSVSWRGRVDMTNRSTAASIASLNRRIEALQKERADALADARTSATGDLAANAEKVGRDTSAIFWASLLIELAGLFCIGFVYFYLSRVFIEQGAATVAALDADDGRRVAGMSGGQIASELAATIDAKFSQLLAAMQPNGGRVAAPIGFHQRGSVQTETPPAPPNGQPEKTDVSRAFPAVMHGVPVAPMPGVNLPPLAKPPAGLSAADVEQIVSKYLGSGQPQNAATVDMVGFLKKYAHVVRALENGQSTKRAAAGCDVSESTVHNCKRCMKTLLAAQA